MEKSNVIQFPGGSTTTRNLPLYQDPEKANLFQEMQDAYSNYRQGLKRNDEKTVKNDLRLVKQLAEYSGKYPWEWKLEDWDDWNTNLYFSRGISKATQRKTQLSIRNFIRYLTSREVFVREVKNRFGAEFDQFIDDEEILHHLHDKEQKDPRLAFTPELADKFFAALQRRIKMESAAPTRKLTNLQRDLTLFYILKATGMRIGSALALNVDSFAPNHEIPEMGQYGAYTVMGKGSKIISDLFDDIKMPPLLEWHIKKIRPRYLKTTNPDERALFLSARGKRLSYGSCWERLQQRLIDADLKLLNLCNHSFRHGKATESGMQYGTETTRRRMNHVYGSTTQGYMSIPDEYCTDQINKGLRNQLKRAISHNKAKENESANETPESP